MASIKALLPLLLASYTTARQCSNFLIPVDITSRQGEFKKVPVESNLDIGAFATRCSEFQSNCSAKLLRKRRKIQLLNHGIGFDKTYWDLDYNNYNYSYVNTALAAGYSTLAIDRLGIALNVVTTKLRNGGIPEIASSYNKVIHVGHSFGSVQSYWLSALYPNNTDGVVLTGYSVASQFLPYIVAGWNLHSARLNQPLRFGNQSNEAVRNLATQYKFDSNLIPGLQRVLENFGVDLTTNEVWNIVASTEILDLITSLQYAFLHPDNYDIGLAVASEKTKQPVTTGELLTIGNAPMMSPFTGPVFVITGEHDIQFCGGNCYGQIPGSNTSTIPAGVKMSYPASSNFESHIQPGTGHGLTFHYNATAGYEVIQKFLGRNGLGA
ncbi:hypothetical protein GQ44DRAFT_831116 [Phaeosphaeriaceae sp. PMI808]|nr:hypothetical protein GQ44DRAFT_831116 [Phaeosphaeriaceae sp. PMI808]